ncbi:MAG: flagellar motor protein MotB [Planctomycetaceae bacterium]
MRSISGGRDGRQRGGAWKVAHADFVTAMMAFFLVMWIVSQDTKVKESISHYFATPLGYVPIGNRNPSDTGGALESKTNGNIPLEKATSMGRGREEHSDTDRDGRHTKLMSDWLHADRAEYDYWKGHADRIRAADGPQSPDPEDSCGRCRGSRPSR